MHEHTSLACITCRHRPNSQQVTEMHTGQQQRQTTKQCRATNYLEGHSMLPERPQIDRQSATSTAAPSNTVLLSLVVPNLVTNIVTAALMRASTPVCPDIAGSWKPRVIGSSVVFQAGPHRPKDTKRAPAQRSKPRTGHIGRSVQTTHQPHWPKGLNHASACDGEKCKLQKH